MARIRQTDVPSSQIKNFKSPGKISLVRPTEGDITYVSCPFPRTLATSMDSFRARSSAGVRCTFPIVRMPANIEFLRVRSHVPAYSALSLNFRYKIRCKNSYSSLCNTCLVKTFFCILWSLLILPYSFVSLYLFTVTRSIHEFLRILLWSVLRASSVLIVAPFNARIWTPWSIGNQT